MKFQDLAKKIKIFHGLNTEQLKRIEPYLEEIKFTPGEWVFEEGTNATGMFVIRSGSIEVWKSVESEKCGFCLGGLVAGDCFGEMSLVDCQRRSANVLAKTDLSVFYLPYDAMSQIYESDPKLFGLLILNIAREISRRLRSTDNSFVEFALPPQSNYKQNQSG